MHARKGPGLDNGGGLHLSRNRRDKLKRSRAMPLSLG